LGILAIWRNARLAPGGLRPASGFFFTGVLIDLVHRPGLPPELEAEGREIVILAGCEVEPPAICGRASASSWSSSPARAQVTLYTRPNEPLPELHYGQPIELDARVRKLRNFVNPGAFDYARFLARQDIFWTASCAAHTLRHVPARCVRLAFRKAVMDLRQGGSRSHSEPLPLRPVPDRHDAGSA
jgi:hypothetical protein